MKQKKVLIGILLLFIAGMFFSCDVVDSLFDGGFKLPPTIAPNTIDFEITGVGTGLRGHDNFPSITLFVSPTDPSDDSVISNLVEADFFDVIDDNGEARPIEVTPRGAVTTSGKMADIVFIIDTTGSMYSYLTTMTNKAQNFADTLAESDINYRLGFVTFGDDIRKGEGERFAPSSDAEAFKTAVGALSAYGGADGPENQIDAIDYARASAGELSSNPAGSFQADMDFLYRDAATRIFILITDIDYHVPGETYSDVYDYYPGGVYNTVEQEIAKLKTAGIICDVVAPESYEDDYSDLATETGGVLYDTSTDDFDDILDDISEEITTRGDYMITFMTNDFSPNKVHTLRLAVHTSLGDAQATATYTSPLVVNYTRAKEIYERGLTK
ncbi:MAG: VWA domain-containing protein [Sphaerochaetaceae bacterium]|nr:VWA domain-containing protein [Sphaerochaetaceae bacterium]